MLGLAQIYLDAVEHRDLASLPLAAGARASENAVPMPIGAGALWTKTTRFASRQMFADPVSGEAMILGAAETDGQLFPYGIRLKIADGRIAEAETLLSASARGHFADVDKLLKPDVLYDAPVPPARGCGSRAALQVVANTYWNALDQSDGSLARFNHRCDRFGNGKKITNSLELLLSPDAAVHTPASLITATRPAHPHVYERRFPVLDVGRGVACSVTIVEFGKNEDRPDVGAFYIFGVVKIVDDQFRNIDHIHAILPAGTRTSW